MKPSASPAMATPRPPSAPAGRADVAQRERAERDRQRRGEDGDEARDAEDERRPSPCPRCARAGRSSSSSGSATTSRRAGRLGRADRDPAEADSVTMTPGEADPEGQHSRIPPRSSVTSASAAKSSDVRPVRTIRPDVAATIVVSATPARWAHSHGADAAASRSTAAAAPRAPDGRLEVDASAIVVAGRRGPVRWPGRPTGRAPPARRPPPRSRAPPARGRSSSGRRAPVTAVNPSAWRLAEWRERHDPRDDRRRADLEDPHRGPHRLGAELPPEAPHAAVADPPARRAAAARRPRGCPTGRPRPARRRASTPAGPIAGSCQWPYTTQSTGPVRRARARVQAGPVAQVAPGDDRRGDHRRVDDAAAGGRGSGRCAGPRRRPPRSRAARARSRRSWSPRTATTGATASRSSSTEGTLRSPAWRIRSQPSSASRTPGGSASRYSPTWLSATTPIRRVRRGAHPA